MKMDQVKMLTKKMVRMGDMFGRVNHAGSLPPSPPPPPLPCDGVFGWQRTNICMTWSWDTEPFSCNLVYEVHNQTNRDSDNKNIM